MDNLFLFLNIKETGDQFILTSDYSMAKAYCKQEWNLDILEDEVKKEPGYDLYLSKPYGKTSRMLASSRQPYDKKVAAAEEEHVGGVDVTFSSKTQEFTFRPAVDNPDNAGSCEAEVKVKKEGGGWDLYQSNPFDARSMMLESGRQQYDEKVAAAEEEYVGGVRAQFSSSTGEFKFRPLVDEADNADGHVAPGNIVFQEHRFTNAKTGEGRRFAVADAKTFEALPTAVAKGGGPP